MFKIKKFCSAYCSFLLIIILGLSLLLAGCSGSGTENAGSDQGEVKEPIVLGDASWASIQVHNRIAGFIIQYGYGYPVDYQFGESLFTLQALGKGDIDILMEVWADNYKEPWEKILAEGTAIDLGANFPDSTQGWYVPTYLIKGDSERGIEALAPDLKSVEDLPEYWELFKDPEKPELGRFHQSPPGWDCTRINEAKFEVYGLGKYYNLFATGSQSSLATSMVSAYEKGEPWLGYYWEPTWIMGKLDMTLLEEPSYNLEKWDKDLGCAYPASKVLKTVNINMQEKAPDVVEFVRKYKTTTEQTNKALAYMQDYQGTGKAEEAAAVWFLNENTELWKSWVPEDVAVKVEQALSEVE